MKKLMIFCSVLAVAAGVSSCGEFLDQVPDNRTKLDDMDKVKALLVSAYPNIYHEALEFRCDGMIDHRATSDGTQPSASFDYTRQSFRWEDYPNIESDVDDQSYFMALYKAIASANHALAAIEELGTPAGSETSIAEARLCRAYGHFMLLTLYSKFFDEAGRETNPGVPFVDEPEDIVNKHYDRGTVASTLARIKEDVAYGLRYVTSTEHTQPKFHFSPDAARMLALRIALYERDYPSVISYASQLVPQPTRTQEIGTNRLDNTPQIAPSADDVAYNTCGTSLYDWVTAYNAYSSSDAFGIAFQRASSSHIILASEPYSLLDRAFVSIAYSRYQYRDSEFDAIIKNNATGLSWRLPAFLLSTMPAGAPNFVPKFYEDFKVTNINANTGQPFCRVALFRREEAILARAEAYTMMGEYDKALLDLSMYVQNRVKPSGSTGKASIRESALTRDKVVNYYEEDLASLTNFVNNSYNASRFSTGKDTTEGRLQRALVMTVLDFRRTEFLYEGYRWFDILRWNIPVTHTMATGESSTLTPDDDRRVLQMPATVVLSGIELNKYENVPNPWS